MKYFIECTCGYRKTFPVNRGRAEGFRDAEDLAEVATKTHLATFGAGHAVTCTRPAHWHDGSITVIVWIANSERRPNLTRYRKTPRN